MRGLQFGHRGEVGGGERGDAQNVYVVLDRLPRGFFGGRKQRSDVDVETDIGEGRCNHLLAAVVAVLADLGDQDSRPAPFGILERVDQRLHFFNPV